MKRKIDNLGKEILYFFTGLFISFWVSNIVGILVYTMFGIFVMIYFIKEPHRKKDWDMGNILLFGLGYGVIFNLLFSEKIKTPTNLLVFGSLIFMFYQYHVIKEV